MPIKKRFIIPILFFLTLYFITRLEFFSFRESPEEQIRQLQTATSLTPTIEQYEVNQQTIQFTHIGDKNLPLIVFIHGSPGSSSAYLDYLSDKRLLENAQLVAVDRPGFGYSDFGKVEISLDKQAKAIKPILEQFRSKKTILVGHSFGGPVIAKLAIDYPHLVEGLVIVAGSIDPDLEPNEWWRKPLNWPVVRWLLPPALRVCNQEILPLEGELRKMASNWAKIAAPVIIIQGEKDRLVPKGNADFAQRKLTNSPKVVIDIIEGGNHFILWSLKDRIVDAILEIL